MGINSWPYRPGIQKTPGDGTTAQSPAPTPQGEPLLTPAAKHRSEGMHGHIIPGGQRPMDPSL